MDRDQLAGAVGVHPWRYRNRMRFPTPAGVELITDDISAGAWLNERLFPWDRSEEGARVGLVVPGGFPAYARILHPARLPVADGLVDVRWSQVALQRGKVIHPEVQFRALLGEEWESGSNQWGAGFQPEEGSMPQHLAAELIPILQRHTPTQTRCWFCVWDGFGFFPGRMSLSWTSDEPAWKVELRRLQAERVAAAEEKELKKIPTVKIHPSPDGRGAFRAYFLFRGPLSAAPEFFFHGSFQSPNYWWPQDRSWCVVTEIDDCSTYVAGSVELVNELLHSDLEVVRSEVEHRSDWWGDKLNG